MKYALITTAMVFGLATPALADETKTTNETSTHQAETLHAPTNRVGDAVPTMTAPADNNAAAESQSGDKKAETVHAPTNRVGEEVPTMKSAENKDKQTKSKTYNNSENDNDKTSTQ